MAGNSFGQLFRVTTFGESHGEAVGCIVDGCPSGIEISEADIQKEMDRRRPGQSSITTPRNESDVIHILSGHFEGKTTGTPLTLVAYNSNTRAQDYDTLKDAYRPSHADFTYEAKYGIRDWRGSGRASARETLARVAAGAVAQKYLRQFGIEIISCVEQVGKIKADIDMQNISQSDVDANIARCPDAQVAKEMIELIKRVHDDGDSIGGVIKGVIRRVPVGLGEPVFDKLSADLGKAMLSINAVKGFEIGMGFGCASMRGSEHNDSIANIDGKVRTVTNNAGGVVGGISNGENIVFRVAFKPVSTIGKIQNTVDKNGASTTIQGVGRHDACVLPRAVPIVDAMSAIVIMDHLLRHQAQNGRAF